MPPAHKGSAVFLLTSVYEKLCNHLPKACTCFPNCISQGLPNPQQHRASTFLTSVEL